MKKPNKEGPSINPPFKKAGSHSFDDDCPPTLNIGQVGGALKFGVLYLHGKLPVVNYLRFARLGPSGIFGPFDTLVAQDKIRAYIRTTGSKQEAMSVFEAPGIFDPNQFSPNTIIRLTPDIRARASVYQYDKTLVARFCHRHQELYEYPRGWVEDPRPIPPIPSGFIGVIRQLPGMRDNIIFMFGDDQLKLMSHPVIPTTVRNPIALGVEGHISIRGTFFDLIGVRIDTIISAAKVEVLEIGKGSRRLKQPQLRPLESARAFGYSPI